MLPPLPQTSRPHPPIQCRASQRRSSGTRPDNTPLAPGPPRSSKTHTTTHRPTRSAATLAIPTISRSCCCARRLSAAPAFALPSHGLPRTAHDRPRRDNAPHSTCCARQPLHHLATHAYLIRLSAVAVASSNFRGYHHCAPLGAEKTGTSTKVTLRPYCVPSPPTPQRRQ